MLYSSVIRHPVITHIGVIGVSSVECCVYSGVSSVACTRSVECHVSFCIVTEICCEKLVRITNSLSSVSE